jgi:hypothetical protein
MIIRIIETSLKNIKKKLVALKVDKKIFKTSKIFFTVLPSQEPPKFSLKDSP